MNRAEQAEHWRKEYERHGPRVVAWSGWTTADQYMQATLRRNAFFRRHLDRFIERTGGRPGVLVDYGAGYGRYLLFLRHRTDLYVGVEIAEVPLKLARKAFGDQEGVRILSVEDAAAAPPRADLVFTNAVLQHQDEEMLADAAALIMAMEPRRLWFHEQSDPAQATQGCWGRTLEQHRAAFPDHELAKSGETKGADGREHAVFSGVAR